VGVTDTDDAAVARREGKPIGIVYPDANGMGTLIVPNCAVLIAGAPHPEAARSFIDYLLRPETERRLAESEAAQMPLRPGVPLPPDVVPIQKIRPLSVDYAMLGAKLERLSQGYLKTWVDTSAAGGDR
jgi:iron(III) transport system substrate-binding protein